MPLCAMGTRTEPRVADDRILTVPNVLSFIRLALLPVVYWDLVSGREARAFWLTVIVTWSDFFDGYIARRFDQVTKLGRLLDPISDRLLVAVLGVGMVVARILPLWALLLLVVRDAVMLIGGAILVRRGVAPPAVTRVGKAATFGLMAALAMFLFARAFDAPIDRVIGWTVYAISVPLYYVAAWQYITTSLAELRARGGEEPQPLVTTGGG